MQILIADSLGDRADAELSRLGCTTTHISAGQPLADAIPGHDVLIVRSTKVDAKTIAAADRLGLIVRAGAGTDTIDTTAAAAAGIFVCNVPGRNAIAVAELTMGLLLSIDRKIVDGTIDARNGHWDKARYSKAQGLAGRTMGIIGLGSIGVEVARRAVAFDLNVVAERRANRTAEIERAIRALGIRLVDDQASVLREADIVSVHVPGGAATKGLVNAEFLAAMQHGAVLLNTSRGSTMIEADLLAALDSWRISAGLDVFPDEPSSSSGPLASTLAAHPSVVATHHIGASTTQAANAVVDGVCEVVLSYQRGDLLNCVNLTTVEKRASTLVVRHIDQVGVLASVLAVLRNEGVNVHEMSNRVFDGALAAVATIAVSHAPDQTAIAAIEAIEPVIGVQVQK